ncbi:uncharacterized protein RCO7_04058 [Rhynchosporium graminicola]|uniref:Uncharacterized protein n=1 Tax=Rhynchosporium graminicola TaxID=2792576 RepID=A0A1E1LFK3_9HELO|nr:uncharacterized protein RCO7_04058 [Rhynchosporium commune]
MSASNTPDWRIIPGKYDSGRTKLALPGFQAILYHWDIAMKKAEIAHLEAVFSHIEAFYTIDFTDGSDAAANYNFLVQNIQLKIAALMVQYRKLQEKRTIALLAFLTPLITLSPGTDATGALIKLYLPPYTINPTLPPWVLNMQRWYDVHRDANIWGIYGLNCELGELFAGTSSRRFYGEQEGVHIWHRFTDEYNCLFGVAPGYTPKFGTASLGLDEGILRKVGLGGDGRVLGEEGWNAERVLVAWGIDRARLRKLLGVDRVVADDDGDVEMMEGGFAQDDKDWGDSLLPSDDNDDDDNDDDLAPALAPAPPPPPAPPAPAPAVRARAAAPQMLVGSTEEMREGAREMKRLLKDDAFGDLPRGASLFNRASHPQYHPLRQNPRAPGNNFRSPHFPAWRGNPPVGILAHDWDRLTNSAHSVIYHNKPKTPLNPDPNVGMARNAICTRAFPLGYIRDIALCLAIEKGLILHDFSPVHPTHTYDDSQYAVHDARFN